MNIAAMETRELQEILHSIFECTKTNHEIESVIGSQDSELALLSHLSLAFQLIDRGTD